MAILRKTLRPTAVALTLSLVFAPFGMAQSLSENAERAAELAELMTQLQDPTLEGWESVENNIVKLWSRSGSDTANLLLKRGRDAIELEDFEAAIEHLTALTDHAPDFAEGWNTRAMAFFQNEQPGLAMADIARVLELNPDHFGALSGLAIILERTGNAREAREIYQRALALNPHRESLTKGLERVERELGAATL